MGAGLGLALSAAGHKVTLLVRTSRPTPPGVGLSVGGADWAESLVNAAVVLVATPDGVVATVAQALARIGRIGREHVVLHLSGLLDRRALEPLSPSGAALGSLHPLQAVADSASGPERLRGAYAAVEGDAGAVAAGGRLAVAAGMIPVVVPASAKPAYHAAAAIASNYTVALADLARRVAESAGIPSETAGMMYLPLFRGTVENLIARGAAGALTGAIRRGDVATVEAHLDALDAPERRLYALLGLETLRIAREAGLGSEAATRLEDVLHAAV